MPCHSFQADDLDGPIRIDLFLARQAGLPSRSQLRQLFDDGLITLNDKPARASALLKLGDRIVVELPELKASALAAEPIPLEIIHQDQDVIVFEKPAGLLTHPIPGVTSGTLVNALLHHARGLSGVGGEIKPGIVHRLDKLTSGVMVAAKNDHAHHHLAGQFKEHSIERRYLAIVLGEMPRPSGTIQSDIARNPKHRLRMSGQTGRGRRAVTHFRVLSRNRGLTLVELRLETGRTHQIRVHLTENNHPVLGDPLYGKGRVPAGRLTPEEKAALHHLKRQALHAYYLGFIHPTSGEPIAFSSPPPEDFMAAARTFGLLDGVPLPTRPGRVPP